MTLLICLFSFAAGLVGSWTVARYGDRMGVCDVADHRSSHTGMTPKGAGAGILAAILAGACFFSLPAWFWFPIACLGGVSFWGGDRQRLSAKYRLWIQFFCSLFFISGLFSAGSAQGLWLLAFPLSVFMVGTANFYNFMDGIDGIAGISGMVGFGLLWGYARGGGPDLFLSMCLVAIFACLGFLWFNLPRARVFLGDVGSVVLGFLFAGLVVLFSKGIGDFIVMAGCLAPFYFDEILTMWVRVRRGESLMEPHRAHTYQLLANELGLPHWKISLGYGLVQLVIGLTGIHLAGLGSGWVLAGYAGFGILFFIFSHIVRKRAGV